MSDESIFAICNYGVLPFWLLLVLAPRWGWTRKLVHSPLPALLLVPVYAWLLFSDDPGPQNGSFFTLQGVMNIFTTPRTVTAGWVHYLVFDLFVGAWEARDAQRLELPHAALVPALVLTLAFGPLGYLLYLAIRAGTRRRLSLVES
jgi:hypothetical protein